VSYVDVIRGNNDTQLLRADEAIGGVAVVAPPLIRAGLQQWVDRQALGLGMLVPNGWVDEAADYMVAVVRELLDYCRDSVSVLREANSYLGSPDSLRAVADTLAELASKADEIQFIKAGMPGLLSWSDPPASEVYQHTVDDLAEPLGRVSSTATTIAGAIDQHADDIENYYLQLAGVIIGAVLTILGIAAAILGVIGALPTGGVSLAASIVGLVSAVAGIATGAIAGVQLFQTVAQGTRGKLDALNAEITEWGVHPFAQIQ